MALFMMEFMIRETNASIDVYITIEKYGNYMNKAVKLNGIAIKVCLPIES